MAERRRPGRPRRSASGGGRPRILRAARALIAARGLRGVSVRDIARRARVNEALLYHYFPDKEELLREALRLSFTILPAPAGEHGPQLEGLGERIALRFLKVWGRPRAHPLIRSLLRGATEERWAARQLRDHIERTIIPATREHLGEAAPRRASVVGSLLLGAGVQRYVVGTRPLATMTDEEVARLLGPVIDAVLTGSIESEVRSAARTERVRPGDPEVGGGQ